MTSRHLPLIALLTLSACQTGQSEIRMEKETALACAATPSKAFRSTLASLHDSLRLKLDVQKGVSFDTLFTEAARIADEEALPHKALLHEEALRILCATPAFAMPDKSTLRPIEAAEKLDLEALSKALTTDTGDPTFSSGLSLLTAYEPVRVAYLTRNVIFGRTFGPEDMAHRSILDSLAPLRPHIVDPNPNNPTVVLVGGNELFTVTMRFVPDRGIYVPTDVGWWKRP